MSASVQISGSRATGSGSISVTRFTRSGSINFSIISKFKQMYHDKPSSILAHWLGISERTAKRKLAGQRPFNVEEIGALIRSEQGFEFIATLMADHKPAWWRILKPLMDSADIRKMQMQAQKRITKILEDALDADQSLQASIARADAVVIRDEEFSRPHADALRPLARAHNRAVVAKPKR